MGVCMDEEMTDTTAATGDSQKGKILLVSIAICPYI
jgi:hypothetical protein